jgi:molybdopterin adenylyltransferase
MFEKGKMRTGVLTLSDKGSLGARVDTSGAAIRELLTRVGGDVQRYLIVPDEEVAIAAVLRTWADTDGLDVILTTGGTGLAPRDVTPRATLSVLDYEVPGIVEALRAEGLNHTPLSMLSRAVAGVRGKTLIVNLPGSERAVRQNLAVLLPVLAHAVETLSGGAGDHVAADQEAAKDGDR